MTCYHTCCQLGCCIPLAWTNSLVPRSLFLQYVEAGFQYYRMDISTMDLVVRDINEPQVIRLAIMSCKCCHVDMLRTSSVPVLMMVWISCVAGHRG